MVRTPPTSRVRWRAARRVVSTRFPPIGLFEDIADPASWEAIERGMAESVPGAVSGAGRLDLVPVHRRVSGPGATWCMAPFVHVSPDRAGRFHDGRFGAWYAGRTFETALAETIHHQASAFRASGERPGWLARVRELVAEIDRVLHDVRDGGFAGCLAPDDHDVPRALAGRLRADGSDGIVYPSVRDTGGECVAIFWPDAVRSVSEGRLLSYHFDGERIDLVRDESAGTVFRVLP